MKVLLKLWPFCVILLMCFIYSINATLITSEKNLTKSTVNKRSSPTTWTDPYDDNEFPEAWSSLLVDYTISKSNRMSRILEGQYQHNFIPSSNFYVTRRIDEIANDVNNINNLNNDINNMNINNNNMNSNINNNNMNNNINNNNNNNNNNNMQRPPRIGNFPSLLGNGGPSNTPLLQQNIAAANLNRQFYQSINNNNNNNNKPLREVSETDLYLLGAMEKLVYRIDYLESRVRRSEQLIYYLMAGNSQNKREDVVADPCPKNFTKIGDNCYHISEQQLNWKSANSFCKSLSSHLAEFEAISENEDIIAFVLNHPNHRGKDFWLGGLNPGLLWIWSNSAKPVNPNTNLTSIANTTPVNTAKPLNESNETTNHKILNNIMEIRGNGRCLRLSYNPSKHTYFYYGQECTSRQNFVCEFEDKTIENQIKKVGRQLNIF